MKRGWLVVASAIALGGCSASGTTSGGDPRFDPAEPIVESSEEDAGSGTRFTDLYRDFFGPTGKASCAGNGQCHGAAEQPGAASSSFVCADQAGCYTSMTGASNLVRTSDASDPANSVLIGILRHRDSTQKVIGYMPKSPAYEFSATSITRISDWIAAGAPND